MKLKFGVLCLLIFVLFGCSKENQAILYGYGPAEISAGKDFNLQPDGASAIWVNVDNAIETTQVVINENILKSTVSHEGSLITLAIPKSLYETKGHYKMYLLDSSSKDKSNEIYFNVN